MGNLNKFKRMVEGKNEGNAQTYFVGIDGSPSSFASFELTMKDLLRPKKDCLTVGHVYN